MDKLLRTLIKDGQISVVVLDGTEMIRHAQIIHNQTAEAAKLFGRCLLCVTYMCDWLKDKDSVLSVNVKHHGGCGEVAISGDGDMNMRGYVFDPRGTDEKIGKGYMTVVRDDHYKTPFVGTCEMVDGDVDKNFEYYYQLSEQLPTYIHTEVTCRADGLVDGAVGVFLQPMPGCDESLKMYAKECVENITGVAELVKKDGLLAVLEKYFTTTKAESREFGYHCSCSREYIAGVLKGMGENELRDILKTEGKINVHCHYCNSDYDFFAKDIDEMFAKDSFEQNKDKQ